MHTLPTTINMAPFHFKFKPKIAGPYAIDWALADASAAIFFQASNGQLFELKLTHDVEIEGGAGSFSFGVAGVTGVTAGCRP
jgi:hypothetical protein